jgi:hypothetical protein
MTEMWEPEIGALGLEIGAMSLLPATAALD